MYRNTTANRAPDACSFYVSDTGVDDWKLISSFTPIYVLANGEYKSQEITIPDYVSTSYCRMVWTSMPNGTDSYVNLVEIQYEGVVY